MVVDAPQVAGEDVKALLIGVAGGIASGKTTVVDVFGNIGATVISADQIGHEVLSEDHDVKHALVEAFGREVLDADGWPDRSFLGSIVFNNPQAMNTLNSIVHPPLLSRMWAEVARAAEQPGTLAVVVDAALIVDWSAQEQFDILIVVTAPEPVRIQRLVAKGLTPEQARSRISAQLSDDQRIAAADVVIRNDSSLADLRTDTERIWQKHVTHDDLPDN